MVMVMLMVRNWDRDIVRFNVIMWLGLGIDNDLGIGLVLRLSDMVKCSQRLK